jgi:competence protein ComEC
LSSKPESMAALRQRLWPKSVLVKRLRFRRAPLLAAAVWFAAGIAAARIWQPVVLLLGTIAVLGVLAIAGLRWSLRIAVVPIAALWMVLGWWCAEVQPGRSTPARQVELARYADGLSRAVRGRVIRVRELPVQRDDNNHPQDASDWEEPGAAAIASVDLEVQAVEEVTPDVSQMLPVTGGVRVTVFDGVPSLRCGDVVVAPLRLREPERYRDPGAWQYADYLLEQGMGTHAAVSTNKIVRVGNASATWSCRMAAAQEWAAGRLAQYVGSPENRRSPRALQLTADDAGMLNAMLFGDRSRLKQPLRIGFERTGSFHLFVVSGMHMALLAGALWWILRRLRTPEVAAVLVTLGLTTAYALLTGFGVPVQRALGMTAIVLASRLLAREWSVLNALGAAALAVLLASPGTLFEASFQMTFLAIVAVAGIAVPLNERSFLPWARATRQIDAAWLDAAMQPELAQFRVVLRLMGDALATVFGLHVRRWPAAMMRWMLCACELALIGLVTECCMSLPMALYFHRATMFALPANMISVPLVAVMAPMGMLTFLAGLISPWAAMLPAWGTALLLHGVTRVIGRISAVRSADWRVPGPAVGVALGVVACIALCCWMVRRGRGWALAGVGVLAMVPVLTLWPEPPVVHPGVMEVTALDVGQGDSILVVSPEGRTMLVDAGGPVGIGGSLRGATVGFDVGEDIVAPYLWSRQLRRLDVVVLTHAHSDHMGGMPAVLRDLRPRELWVGVDPDSAAYRALLAEAQSLGIVVRHWRAGDAVGWGGVRVTMLAPEVGYANPAGPLNNDSLVMRLAYGSGSVLLEGDAEAASEQAMVERGRVQPVTVLKVGHHGSNTSSGAAFLAAAEPREAVISVGKWNTFGHPRVEVIDRLAAAQVRLFRTDEMGLTTFLVEHNGGVAADASN